MHECISGKRDRVWLGVFFMVQGDGEEEMTRMYIYR